MTAECCTDEHVTALWPQTEPAPCRARSREDEAPPQAAELFGEAGLAILIPLVISLLITLGSGIPLASVP